MNKANGTTARPTSNCEPKSEISAWIDGNAKRRYHCHGDAPRKVMIITISKQL